MPTAGPLPTSERTAAAGSPFRDPALERAYQADAARVTQRPYRTIYSIALAVVAGMGLVDPFTGGSAANLRVIFATRYGLVVPLLLGVAAIGWAPARVFARYRQAALTIGAMCLNWSGLVIALLAPDKAVLDLRSGPMSIAFSFVVTFVLSAILAARNALIAVETAAALALAYVVMAAYPSHPENGAVSFWLIASAVVGGLSAWQIDRSRRQAFLSALDVERERAKSEALLRNVLPAAIAERLKADPSHIADGFSEVTILFADIVGFTDLSSRLEPAAVVAMLNRLFSRFDDLAEQHRLEKIKTIGDAYMVVGGLPEPRADHAQAVVSMALAMRDAVAHVARETGYPLAVRIGANSGAVVAGVIGKKKFTYDLWGDAVNTASRMESHGLAGEIQISAATREHLKDAFVLESRGTLAVRGKGEMAAWLVKGARPT